MSVFSFLVAAGFEPTSLSLQSGRINRYTMLTPQARFLGTMEISQGFPIIILQKKLEQVRIDKGTRKKNIFLLTKKRIKLKTK